MYESFQTDPLALGVFLDSLETYVLDGRLTTMTPQIVKDFVNHFADKGRFEALEACIVRLDIAILDIHQVRLNYLLLMIVFFIVFIILQELKVYRDIVFFFCNFLFVIVLHWMQVKARILHSFDNH